MQATWHPSPNFAPREQPIKYIVIHGTWMPDNGSALQRLCDPAAEVSCHYYIEKNGKLLQLVKDENVAWHAGVSKWREDEQLNATSLGIEMVNEGEGIKPYTTEQYATLIHLLRDLIAKHNIPLENVLGHSDIAVGRKTDPGLNFSWGMLELAQVAAQLPFEGWPSLEELHDYGYHGEHRAILEAYKRRAT